MSKAVKLSGPPRFCYECEFLDHLTIDGVNFPACRNRDSFDKQNRPLFVMPDEEPPEFCGLRRKQFFDMMAKANEVAKKFNAPTINIKKK